MVSLYSQTCSKGTAQIGVYDLNGKLIVTEANQAISDTGKWFMPLRLPGLPNGMYIVHVVFEGQRSVYKIFKQ